MKLIANAMENKFRCLNNDKCRCPWCLSAPEYIRYHDEEWGVPVRDGRALFAKLQLDGAQAGLSWLTILRKREAYYAAFADFAPERIARFGAADVERLMHNSGIIRNRRKIEGVVKNARAFLDFEEKTGDFGSFLWDFVGGEPYVRHPRSMKEVPASTRLSEKIARDLKQRGFVFVGPTIVYAFMQAVGMVDDHLERCWRKNLDK